jgi:hypothetical protein
MPLPSPSQFFMGQYLEQGGPANDALEKFPSNRQTMRDINDEQLTLIMPQAKGQPKCRTKKKRDYSPL